MLASGCLFIFSHLANSAARLLLPSGIATFCITALIAARMLSDDGATASCWKGVPVSSRGMIGHCHLVDASGPSGNSPSAALMPGHDPDFAASPICVSSSGVPGKRKIWFLMITPQAVEDDLEIWQIILAENRPMFHSVRSALSSGVGGLSSDIKW